MSEKPNLHDIVAKCETAEQVEATLTALDRIDCEESLYRFMRAGWHAIDPALWIDGWPIEAVAEHLQAVVDGDIRRLIINIPPRMAKSSMCSVALPAWTWTQPERRRGSNSGPQVRFLHASYAEKLSLRDSVKCRRLIQSPWYQRLWGDRFQLSSDQNVKHRFSNNQGGERLITSIGAAVTGEGGDVIVIDDPNSASEAFSEATIESTKDWWDQTMSTRLNNPKTGAFIIIQQRLAQDDLTGHILEKSKGEWTHLCLPMHYDPSRSFVTGIGWKDPRSREGELLMPERFGPEEVSALESSLGPWAASGQLEQDPKRKGGGILKREWWLEWEDLACGKCERPKGALACKECPAANKNAYPAMDYVVAALDTAYTAKEENDPSAMTIWGVLQGSAQFQATRMLGPDGRPIDLGRVYENAAPKIVLMYAWSERYEFPDLVKRVWETCNAYGVDKLLIESKAAGHSVAQELRKIYGADRFGVQLVDPGRQDKMARLYSVQHLFSEGMVFAPDRSWVEKVIAEAEIFPRGRHDDLTDTISLALRHLREAGLLTRAPELLEEVEAMKTHTGRPPQALYPA